MERPQGGDIIPWGKCKTNIGLTKYTCPYIESVMSEKGNKARMGGGGGENTSKKKKEVERGEEISDEDWMSVNTALL